MAKVDQALVAMVEVRIASSWRERTRGLLGTSWLPPGHGLEIVPCSSVHTFGMRYAIDVIFLDKKGRVLKVVHGLPPGRMAAAWGARSVLEVAAGQAKLWGVDPGQRWDRESRRFLNG